METANSAPTVDEDGLAAIRARLHRTWDSVAPGWAANADYADARGAAVTSTLCELAAPANGERVLELAAGAGGVGLAAATLVGASGEVVISDVAPNMTAIAARRAAELRLDNVSTRELDLEAIDEPDESYDVVLCREGIMLVPDPGLAAREIRRVLRPGGRVAVAVWGPRERNPWLGIVFDVVSAQLGAPVPPPGIPGPFSLADGGLLRGVLAGAGLDDVEVREVDVPYGAASVAEWWARTTALAGPLADRLHALTEPARAALAERATAAAGDYRTSTGLTFPGVSLVAGATRR